MGEANLDYSLSPQSMPSFLSSNVNGKGKKRWEPVTEEQKKELLKRSNARMTKSSDFADLAKQVEEIKTDDGIVRISELLKKDSNEKKDEQEEASRDLFEIQKEEAINILVDLVELQN